MPTLRRVLLMLAVLTPMARAADAQDQLDETPSAHDARMSWWRDARFGMFIHWGIYSVPAGNYHGERVGGGEWIMNNSHIPIAEYEQFARAFNPVRYDADV